MTSIRSDLQVEGSMYIGIILFGILYVRIKSYSYSVLLTLYFSTVYFLLKSKSTCRWRQFFYILYSSTLLILTTIVFAAKCLLGQLMWTIYRDEHNPIINYSTSPLSVKLVTLSNTIPDMIILIDGMILTYRCYIIFESSVYMAVAPAVCNLAFLILGIVNVALPRDSPALGGLTMAQGILVMPTNILASVMIAIRIMIVSRRINRYVNQRWERQFTGIAAILIESAAPSTVLWIIALVIQINYMDGKETYRDPVISLSWSALVSISPHLIVLRIAMDMAWDENTSRRLSTIASLSVESDVIEIKLANSDELLSLSLPERKV